MNKRVYPLDTDHPLEFHSTLNPTSAIDMFLESLIKLLSSSHSNSSESQGKISATYEQLKRHSAPFLVISQKADEIVYADPCFPNDMTKRITYTWNGREWIISFGENARAIILDHSGTYLKIIQDNQLLSYGTPRKPPSIQRTTDYSMSASPTAVPQETSIDILEQDHSVILMNVPEDQLERIQKTMDAFRKIPCKRKRAQLVTEFMLNDLEGYSLLNPTAHQDTDGSYTFSYQNGTDNFVQMRVRGKEFSLSIPEDSASSCLAIMYHPDRNRGILGNDIVLAGPHKTSVIRRLGVSTSEATLNASMPHLSGSVNRFKRSDLSIRSTVQQPALAPSAQQISTAQPTDKPIIPANSTELTTASSQPGSLAEIRALGSLLSAPSVSTTIDTTKPRISVTGLDGNPLYELRKGPIEESNCGKEGNHFEGHVYLFKKISQSSTVTETDHVFSDYLILEVRPEPFEIYVNAGMHFDEDSCVLSYATAKIRVSMQDKTFDAFVQVTDECFNISSQQEQAKVSFPSGSPFKIDGGFKPFMCFDNCMGHYSKPTKDELNLRANLNTKPEHEYVTIANAKHREIQPQMAMSR